MITITNYLSAFWSVVVLNCIQPVNWEYCAPVNEWLFPEVRRGVKIFMDSDHTFLYQSEREALNNDS